MLLFALTGAVHCGNADRDPSPGSAEGGHAGTVTTGGVGGRGGNGGVNSGGSPADGGAPVTGGAAAGGASGGKASSNDWEPDFPLGTPGWKDSREPFCDVNQGRVTGAGVFADARGVFALVNNECVRSGRDLPTCTTEGERAAGVSLSFNDGSGWRALLDAGASQLTGLTGFEGGPLLLAEQACSAALFDVDAATSDCALASRGDSYSRRAFVANDSLAYVTDEGGLHEYRSGEWSTLLSELPETIYALWANEEIVYLGGEYQIYALSPGSGGTVSALPNAPAAQYMAVWGFASDDVWFANSAGQLIHYDGQEFRQGPIPTGKAALVSQLWGSDGELFFATSESFGRVTAAAERETLLATEVVGFWGTSPRDVFISVHDENFTETACGAAFFLYFDGNEFHRF